MRQFSTSPREMVASFWRNRILIGALIKREVVGRYRGSVMGILWSFFNPLFMLAIYTFVFSVVFKARWQQGGDSKTEFALLLFCGLIVFNLFAECVGKSPTLIIANANYVKKVIFPLEILPWVALGSAGFHAGISLVVWLAAYVVLYGLPHATVLLFPLILLPLIMLTLGISWLLSSLGVFLRDVSQFVGIVISVLMFMSPIFYPASALPEKYRHFLMLNPLTTIIEQTRNVLFWGEMPSFRALALFMAVAAIVFWAGFVWFQKTRKGFADVI
jgi:lipopolysaccharide transport system permease protein